MVESRGPSGIEWVLVTGVDEGMWIAYVGEKEEVARQLELWKLYWKLLYGGDCVWKGDGEGGMERWETDSGDWVRMEEWRENRNMEEDVVELMLSIKNGKMRMKNFLDHIKEEK